MSHASPYTPEQLAQYLEFIGLPQKHHPVPGASTVLDLHLLTVLHAHQISTIPYENLSLHYSSTKQVDLDADILFDKFINKKRGGYCLELSLFYHYMLRALGFQVYIAGVRIRLRRGTVPEGPFVGLRHVVNLVSLPGETSPFMIDVGFGGDGATKPLPLIHDRPQHNLGTQSIRLIHDTIDEQLDRSDDKKLWIYQYRNGSDKDWNSYYAFAETEFMVTDLKLMNHWLCTHPDSFQRWVVLAIKFLRADDRIVGKTMLVDNLIKRNLGGKTELVAQLASEEERLRGLKDWFGLEVSESEAHAIQGHNTEIVAQNGA